MSLVLNVLRQEYMEVLDQWKYFDLTMVLDKKLGIMKVSTVHP